MNIMDKEIYVEDGYNKILLSKFHYYCDEVHETRIEFKTLGELSEEEVEKISKMVLPKSEILVKSAISYNIEIESFSTFKPSEAFKCLSYVLVNYNDLIHNLSYLYTSFTHIQNTIFDPIPNRMVDIYFRPSSIFEKINSTPIGLKRFAIEIRIMVDDCSIISLTYNINKD